MTQLVVEEKLNKINAVLFKTQPLTNGFFGGTLGLLFYYFHAGNLLKDKNILTRSYDLIEALFEALNADNSGLVNTSLFDGFTGFAYVSNYLVQHKFLELEVNEEFKELDIQLFTAAKTQIEADDIDYLHGALGIILYFTERDQNPEINNYLNILVTKLMSRAIIDDFGIWFKNTTWKNPEKNEEINFSLSHGLCSVLLILLKAYPLIDQNQVCEKVIREGIRTIIKHELPVDFDNEEFSYFPGSFNPKKNEIFRFNRLAWCYGDLNVVLLLYRAGIILNDSRYTNIANRIGLKTVIRKKPVATHCINSHFCHGSAGLAQLYKAIYFETSNRVYKDAYENWINITLSYIDKEINENIYIANNAGLLEGWAGVALVLTDYLAETKLNWTHAFLL